MSDSSLATRAFGTNASCPAVQQTDALGVNTTHAACYGPYQTGELGVNITYILGLCCSGTLNETDPVYVTYDEWVPALIQTDCWSRCEAPWIEDRIQPDNGRGFFALEKCIREMSYQMASSFDNSTNPYQIWCFPKTSKTEATPSKGAPTGRISGVSMWALGFLGLLVVPLLSA